MVSVRHESRTNRRVASSRAARGTAAARSRANAGRARNSTSGYSIGARVICTDNDRERTRVARCISHGDAAIERIATGCRTSAPDCSPAGALACDARGDDPAPSVDDVGGR